jgi:anti-sigma regulatory factor (Ser/Thr protein kinase)
VDLRTELGADPSEVSRARHLVADCLLSWGLDAETREIAVLLVSELVTNALRHGQPPLWLGARTGRDGLRVEVHDGLGAATPVLRDIRPDEPGGRGLRLVDALAGSWGATADGDGKVVWFLLPDPPAGDLPALVEPGP